MKLKALASSMILLAAGSAAFAAESNDYIIPVAGNVAGANGSLWQSELTLHNAGADTLPLTLTYHDSNGAAGSFSVSLAPRTTTTINDVVGTKFQKPGTGGAIVIDADDSLRKKLAVTSRTFNLSPAGEFGQDIPALTLEDSLTSGDTGIINGPGVAARNRFNFGIYSIEASEVDWQLLRKDGTVAAEKTQLYPAGVQLQYNNGVVSLFSQIAADNDVIHAKVRTGRVLVYGSMVDQATGDPTYIQGNRTRENLFVEFIGLDLDENGQVDIRDANGDNVLDRTLVVPTQMFPTFFRIVSNDPEGKTVTYTLIDAPRDVKIIDSIGTIQWFPSSEAKGGSVNLTVRASDGIDSVDFIIPVTFN